MIDFDAPLTARQLVTGLGDLGVGRWSPAAVRQWIREEPPLAIAEHADQGKPHRYQLRTVLTWLKARAVAERAKGFSRGDGDDLVGRIDAALLGGSTVGSILEPTVAVPRGRGPVADQASLPLAPAPTSSSEVSPAKERAGQTDWIAMSDVDSLIAVLQGRDPRNWKAAEEALSARRERLVAERRLIPIEELELAIDLQTEHTRRGIAIAQSNLKLSLRDFINPESQAMAERIIDQKFEEMLKRLADTSDLESPPSAELLENQSGD